MKKKKYKHLLQMGIISGTCMHTNGSEMTTNDIKSGMHAYMFFFHKQLNLRALLLKQLYDHMNRAAHPVDKKITGYLTFDMLNFF